MMSAAVLMFKFFAPLLFYITKQLAKSSWGIPPSTTWKILEQRTIQNKGIQKQNDPVKKKKTNQTQTNKKIKGSSNQYAQKVAPEPS